MHDPKIILGNARDVLKAVPTISVNLILTSPPYADSRAKTYGGIKPDQYVDWFLPISAELLRVLKPSGTFILNIKARSNETPRFHT
jgi:site-specific DNA-methyltransferase (adenine-specific)